MHQTLGPRRNLKKHVHPGVVRLLAARRRQRDPAGTCSSCCQSASSSCLPHLLLQHGNRASPGSRSWHNDAAGFATAFQARTPNDLPRLLLFAAQHHIETGAVKSLGLSTESAFRSLLHFSPIIAKRSWSNIERLMKVPLATPPCSPKIPTLPRHANRGGMLLLQSVAFMSIQH